MAEPIRALYIEEDDTDARLFQKYLHESPGDYHIEVSRQLSDAIDRLSKEHFDIVLMDLGLSDAQGIDAFRLIHDIIPGIPIIVLSGLRDERLAMQAVHEGAQDYLIKGDISPRALARSVDYAVERKSSERRIIYLNRLLQSIQHINRLIIREKDEPGLLQKACDILHSVGGFSIVWIGLLDDSGPRIIPAAAAGLELDFLRGQIITWDDSPTGRGPSGTAVKARKSCVFTDLDDERFSPWHSVVRQIGVTSCAASPLIVDGTLFGVLNVYSRGGDILDEKEVALVEETAEDLAFAISTIRMGRQQTRMAEALRETEKVQKAILNNIPDMAWLKDKKGRFVAVNEPFGRRCGFTPEDLVGKTDLDIWPGELARRYRKDDREVIHSGVVKIVEEPLADIKGKTQWIETIKTPIHNNKGEIIGTTGIARDITERKNSEQRMIRLNDCFTSLTPNPTENINLLAALCGELTGAVFVLYNRLENGLLHVVGSWNLPQDCVPIGPLDGRICADTIAHASDEVFFVRDLPSTQYAETDPTILRYHLITYAGKAVEAEARVVGSLCAVYTKDVELGLEDKELIGIVASAIGVEEERLLFEEKIREQLEILDQIHDIVITTDLKGNITSWNKGAERLLGYKAEEMQGRPVRLIYPEREYETTRKRTISGLRGNGEMRDEFTIKRKDGSEFPVHLTLTLRRNKDGKTTGIIGSAVDITERKVVEEALRESRETYRAMFEDIHAVMLLIEPDTGRIVDANGAACDFYGYPKERLLQMVIMDINTLSERETKQEMARARAGKKNLFNFRHRLSSGEVRDVDVYSGSISVSGRTLLFSIIHDVTERKKTEEALRESEQRYRSLFDHNQDAVYSMDMEGNFLSVNKAACLISGYSEEEMQSMSFAPLIAPEYLAETRRHFIESTGGKTQYYESCIGTKDRGLRYIDVTNTPIVIDGKVVGVYGIARDITDRKEAEETLREREKQLSAVTENLTGPVSRVDRDLRYLFANSVYERWHGSSPQAIMGLTVPEVIGDEAFRRAEPYLRRALAGNRVTFESPIESPSGEVLYGLVSYIPDIDSEGRVQGLFIIVTDITERKKAEEALRASEEKYRVVVENGNEAIVVAQDNALKFVNPQTERLSGYSKEELLGRPFIEFIHPEDRDALLTRYQNRLVGVPAGQPERFRVHHKNGEIRWAETGVVTIDWEGRPAALVFAHDITDQKRAEEALRDSEERFRTLFESSKDAILIVTAAGRIIAINSAGRELFGYTEEEINSINTTVLYVNPDSRERFRRQIEADGYIKDSEIAYKKKDGTMLDCLETATVIRDEKGSIVGYQGTIRDVTEHKKMEMQLLRAEKLSTMGTMISGVAHELNNPLTSIIGNAQLLAKRDVPEEIKIKLDVILKESMRSSKIVGGLLAFAREHKPERKMINICNTLMESLKLREYDLKVNGIDVQTYFSDDLPETYADPYQLQQVFINLINNSRDALADQEGGALAIRVYRIDDSVLIEFEDNGPGIPDESINKIFDPFFTTKEVGKGTGLGLSMAYGIIKEHGGIITVESKPGKGAKFIVTLPITEGAEPMVEEVKATVNVPPGAKTVLVVEDEESLRDLLSEALAEGGFFVEAVSNGEQAIRLVGKRKFDAVISDIKMPGIGGRELYLYIQKHHPEMAEKVVFITGDVLNKDTLSFLQITNNRYIEKPFNVDALVALLNNVLSK